MALRDLVVNLVGKTQQFDKKMKGSGSAVDRFKRRVADGGKAVAAFTKKVALLGTAIAGVGAGALAYFVRQEMQALDATAKLAAQIGLASQSLMEYQHAANLGGVSNEAFAQSIRKMNELIGEAVVRGTGTAADAFRELGLDVQALEQAGADKAFMRISDAISRVDSSARKLHLAKSIFGRSGVELLPMLNEGAEGIEAMRNEFRDLFGVMEEADFKAIEIANDQIAGVKVGIRGLVAQITAKLAPAIAAVARRFKEWIKGVDLKKWAQTFVDALLAGVKHVMAAISQIKVAWLKVERVIAKGLHLFEEANASRLATELVIGRLTPGITDDTLRKTEQQLVASESAAARARTRVSTLDSQIAMAPSFRQSIDEWGDRMKSAMDEITDEAEANAAKSQDRLRQRSSFSPVVPLAAQNPAREAAIIRKTVEQVDREIDKPSVRVSRTLDTRTQEGFQAIAEALAPRGARDPQEDIRKNTERTADETADMNRFLQTKLPGLTHQHTVVPIPV